MFQRGMSLQMAKFRILVLILGILVSCLIWFTIKPVRVTRYVRAKDSEDSDYKYILAWTPDTPNVKLLGWSYPELDGFNKAGCREARCFMTNNRSHLGEIY